MTTESKQAPDFMRKLCPVLTIGRLTPQVKSMVAMVGGARPEPEGEAIGCQGGACAWFVPISDVSGNVVSGGCAMALLPTTLANIGMTAQQAVAALVVPPMTERS